jgi:hypothetical protein
MNEVVENFGWLSHLRVPIAAGVVPKKLLRIPQSDAQKLLRGVVRRVADLPVGSSATVVWHDAGAELLVLTDKITIGCSSGLVTIGVTAQCDQTDGAVVLSVPFAVGTAKAQAGLVMHTFSRVAGPPVVTDRWSQAITAFAWEALLELASTISAEVGKDTAGRPLVPGAIAAEPEVLLIQPMARHDLSSKGG